MIQLSLGIENWIVNSLVPALHFVASDVMLSVVWVVCMDGCYEMSRTISGAVNTAVQIGGVIISVGYGVLINAPVRTLPHALVARSCFASMAFWLKIGPDYCRCARPHAAELFPRSLQPCCQGPLGGSTLVRGTRQWARLAQSGLVSLRE